MTRPQSVLFLSECFVALSSLSKIIILISSIAGDLGCPIWFHIFFILAFFSSWPLASYFFTPGVVTLKHTINIITKAQKLKCCPRHTSYRAISSLQLFWILSYWRRRASFLWRCYNYDIVTLCQSWSVCTPSPLGSAALLLGLQVYIIMYWAGHLLLCYSNNYIRIFS